MTTPAPSGRSGRRAARPITLASLRGFEAAARHLSFTLAATELNLTQSSISRQVAELERQVGRALFERRTRALELTDHGERLFRTVQQALATVDRTVDEIRGVGTSRRVSISTYASFASLWLVPRLSEFQRTHPGVDIRIDASDRMVDLESDGIDVVVRWLRPGAHVPNDAPVLLDEEMSPAMSPRLLADTRARDIVLREPADLAKVPLLAMDESVPSSPYSGWANWCEYAGIAPFEGATSLYFTFVDQCVQAAVRGQGVALVRTPFLDDLVASNDLVLPFPNLRMRTGYRYFLLTNRQRSSQPHVAAFTKWIVDEFERGPHRRT
jgi:LysR family transcriptional regulator, glycine cleavage system transcriptional activator